MTHVGGTQCTSCHDPVASHHTFQITDAWNATCRNCHADANGDPKNIRLIRTVDYDGDGNTTEPLAAEIDGLAARTLAAMQAVAAAPGLCYAEATYPYFFKDTNGDKSCSAAEAVSSNGFSAWTAGLVEGGVQLPAVAQGARRLGAQLRLHGPAPLRQHGGSGR